MISFQPKDFHRLVKIIQRKFKMKNLVALLSLLAVFGSTIAAQKLQIGIKKRVENCEIKAQKGDLVHIHYTVST